MAINYNNLFTNLGTLVGVVRNLQTIAGAMNQTVGTANSWVASVLAQYGSTSVFGPVEGFDSEMVNDEQIILGLIDNIGAFANATMLDRDTVLAQLPLGDDTSLENVLAQFLIAMTAAAQSVGANTVTIGAISAGSLNNNSVTTGVLLTAVMDGVQSPRSGIAAQPGYAGLTSQVSANETITLICSQDSEAGGTSEGSEQFDLLGGIPQTSNFNWRENGSGTGPTILVMNGEGIITNGEFDTFTTANAPDSWTITSGAAGTEIFEDAADVVLTGGGALKLKGTGTTATLTQDATGYGLIPLQAYRVACWIKGDATIAAGTLTILFTGTGYTAASSEKINLNSAALAALAGYTVKSFVIVMPRAIPDDIKLQISIASLTANKFVKIDRLAMQPINYFGGVGINILAGANKYLQGDKFTFTLANDHNSPWQNYFTQQFGLQLPTSGSPTQIDTLCEILPAL